MTERFRIAQSPNITAPHNRKTWGQLEAQIGGGSASFEEPSPFVKDMIIQVGRWDSLSTA